MHQNPEISVQTQEAITRSRYDYDEVLGELEKRGKSLYGSGYVIQAIDRPVLVKVLCYFLQDAAMAAAQKISLRKGLMLCGPVGCGKTSTMHIIRSLMPDGDAFGIVSCRNIATRFNQDGFAVVDRYSAHPRPGTLMRSTYCFDDMGLEPTGNFYQNECNVVAEILFNRYEAFVQEHIITHITTNLGIGELEACYGNRLRSRMREMLNLVAFDAASPDKRR